MTAQLVEFPPQVVTDVSKALRSLADSIESGDYGEAHNLAWVIDCGEGRIEIGMLGRSPEFSTAMYYLFGLGKRKIEAAGLP